MPRVPTIIALCLVSLLGAAAWAWMRFATPAAPAVNTVAENNAIESRAPAGHPSKLAPQKPIGPAWFTEVTAQTGIDFMHVSGASADKPFPAENGSGVAALDYDMDGNYDLYFATGAPFPLDPKRAGPANHLYRNQSGLHFVDVTAASGTGIIAFSVGLAVGDYDNDGFPDLFVNCYGEDYLLHNEGDGTFRLATGLPHDDRWGTGAAWLDYDGDGLLDLYVVNYGKWTWETNPYCGDRTRKIRLNCSPTTIPPEKDRLFHNQGDGTFEDTTEKAGLSERLGRGQGAIAADLNGDGLIDLYVANDLHPNFLFLNQGGGHFRDASEVSGTSYDETGAAQAGMGLDVADVDHNGLVDIFITNFKGEHNTLYLQQTAESWTDASARTGVAALSIPWVGWGTSLEDFNLDGWPDLVVVNGHVDDNRELLGEDTPYAEPAIAWRNDRGHFEPLSREAGDYFTGRHVSRGLAVVDLDNDGAKDLVITHMDGPPSVLRNNLPGAVTGQHASVTLRLVGTKSNRDAVGAQVTLKGEHGRTSAQVMGGGSYLSARDLRMVWGVPSGATTLDFEIRWPSGVRSSLSGLQPGHIYSALEPTSEPFISPVSSLSE